MDYASRTFVPNLFTGILREPQGRACFHSKLHLTHMFVIVVRRIGAMSEQLANIWLSMKLLPRISSLNLPDRDIPATR
jgi:hypothetical protein